MKSALDTVVVVGSGTMGHGISQVVAATGRSVTMVDTSEALLAKGLSNIERNLSKGVDRGKVSPETRDLVLANVSCSTDLAGACESASLVIEAVPEKLELKRGIFETIDGAAPAHAVLASNTSSMSITVMGSWTRRPDKVIGLHFFNPVHIMSLLEIVRGELTSEETLQRCLSFSADIGKTAITVLDAPGFATSRLGIAIAMEAIRMLEQGVASAEDIDKAMVLGYRFPMGPLKLTDLVGLDVRLAITEHLYSELGTDTFRPPQLLKRMVRAGKLGKKSGLGFYDWKK